MPYPVLTINPSLVLPRKNGYNTLDSGQGIGRSLRRTVDSRNLLGYNVTFDKVTCTDIDNLLAVIHTPFQLTTPDDGVVSVVIDSNSLTIVSLTPDTYRVAFSVEQVLFTN